MEKAVLGFAAREVERRFRATAFPMELLKVVGERIEIMLQAQRKQIAQLRPQRAAGRTPRRRTQHDHQSDAARDAHDASQSRPERPAEVTSRDRRR